MAEDKNKKKWVVPFVAGCGTGGALTLTASLLIPKIKEAKKKAAKKPDATIDVNIGGGKSTTEENN